MVPQHLGLALVIEGVGSPESNPRVDPGGGMLPHIKGKGVEGQGRNRPAGPRGTEFYMASHAAAPVWAAAEGAHGQGRDSMTDAGGRGT